MYEYLFDYDYVLLLLKTINASGVTICFFVPCSYSLSIAYDLISIMIIMIAINYYYYCYYHVLTTYHSLSFIVAIVV